MNIHEIDILKSGLMRGKGFSIITNFGCDKNCWYCIWKRHPMRKMKKQTDFEELQRALALVGLHQAANDKQVTVSISGGGEPLNLYPSNLSWFEEFFKLVKMFELHTSLHTGNWKRACCSWLMEKFDEYVLHFTTYMEFYNNILFIQEMRQKIPIRIAFVLTSKWKPAEIKHAVTVAEHTLDCKISFRELWAIKDEVSPEVIEYVKGVQDIYSQARYVTQADYNIYYMPDNKIYTTFMLEDLK